jgi:hypothetical protein
MIELKRISRPKLVNEKERETFFLSYQTLVGTRAVAWINIYLPRPPKYIPSDILICYATDLILENEIFKSTPWNAA